MEGALRREGFEERQLFPKGPKVWSLPAADIIRFFWPGAYRRPWGFVYSGAAGIEIPRLRDWLHEHKPRDEAGIFHSCFVSYLIANEEVLGDFQIEHGKIVPADLWAGLLRDRIARVPETLDGLIAAYRGKREELGWLGGRRSRDAWSFLLDWYDKPDPSLHVPKMLPDGRII
ncbi:MAG TPA: hypothetical protein VF582_05465 [Allosphingosinicella sp.]